VAPSVVPLPNDLTGPSLARRSIHAFAVSHQLDDEVKNAAEVITSELVTNAIVHGDTPVILSI
jgi:anti-sigma regulatory factor (Ser/Thr protein kinase)